MRFTSDSDSHQFFCTGLRRERHSQYLNREVDCCSYYWNATSSRPDRVRTDQPSHLFASWTPLSTPQTPRIQPSRSRYFHKSPCGTFRELISLSSPAHHPLLFFLCKALHFLSDSSFEWSAAHLTSKLSFDYRAPFVPFRTFKFIRLLLHFLSS